MTNMFRNTIRLDAITRLVCLKNKFTWMLPLYSCVNEYNSLDNVFTLQTCSLKHYSHRITSQIC